jgi:hypothetical protein
VEIIKMSELVSSVEHITVRRSDGSTVNCIKRDDGGIYDDANKRIIILQRSNGDYQACDTVCNGLFIDSFPMKVLWPHVVVTFKDVQTGVMFKQVSIDIFQGWNGCGVEEAKKILEGSDE